MKQKDTVQKKVKSQIWFSRTGGHINVKAQINNIEGGEPHDNLSHRLGGWVVKKCPAFKFCPLTTVLGDQQEEDEVDSSNKVWEESFPPEKNKNEESEKE